MNAVATTSFSLSETKKKEVAYTHPMLKRGVLLVNLGTPDRPTYGKLRSYLNQFLTDRRVIDLPVVFRHLLFKGIVVPMRSGRVAKLYQRLWMKEGSPLKVYGQRIVDQVQADLGKDYQVKLAMRYQNPSIKDALEELIKSNVSEIVIFPLFPQYASATTGSIFEEVMNILKKKEQIPSLRLINSYYDHPAVINLYAQQANEMNLDNYDHFVFSFHGVPKRYLKKENDHCRCDGVCCKQNVPSNQFCYAAQCHRTAFAIANKLSLNEDQFTISYQSRFGPEEWIQPYTDEVFEKQLKLGKKKILVFSPAFVADCLETTIEIGYEYKEEFIKAGGELLDLVPSLNDSPTWAAAITSMVR